MEKAPLAVAGRPMCDPGECPHQDLVSLPIFGSLQGGFPERSDPGVYLLPCPEIEVAEFTTKRKLTGFLQSQDMLR